MASSMISDELVPFLESGVSLLLGTRDRENRPACARLVGARVSEDRTKVTVLLPRPTGERCLANIAESGLAAVTFSRVMDNRAVQVKGRVVAREPTADDMAVAQTYREAFAVALDEVGLAPARSTRLTLHPAVALDVTVEAIFQQTPGPSAGQKLA